MPFRSPRLARFLPLALLALAAPLPVCPAAGEAEPWFRRSLVGLEVGPTGAQFGGSEEDDRYCSRFDGAEIVRRSKASGAEYLVMWARDGDWTYYDSALQPKAPALGSRDPLREAVEGGKRAGLPVVAYCQVQYPAHTLREHPEWNMVAADGTPAPGRVCYRSGYLDYMKKMVEEQLAYGIAGFHLDMIDQGFGPPHGCFCATCKREYEAANGAPMPDGSGWGEARFRLLEFRYESSAAFERALTAHIRSIDPKASVDYNYHGNPPFSWEVGQLPVRHAGNGDFVTGETGVWGFSALTVGLNAEFYRAATPGFPYQVAMQRGVRMYHDQTTRPLNDIRWELLTLLSRGAFVTIVDKTAFDGSLDPVAYERFGEAFREVAAKREHFGHKPVREVGILFSSATRDRVGRDAPAEYFRCFQGAHKAMEYEHVQWGVLLDENLSPESLAEYPVVLLPNVGVLRETEIALLRQYAERGGALVVAGWTGLFDELGEPREDSAIADLIGARLVSRLDSTDNWYRFPADADANFLGDLRRDWNFLVRGPAAVYEATTATPVGSLLKPHRTRLHKEGRYDPNWPLSADEPVGPAVLIHRVGKGTVLTFAGSPDAATASEHHIAETRRLLADAVRSLAPEPIVEIDAPVNVQAIATDDPANRRLRIHLLHYGSPPQTTPAKDRPYVLPALLEDLPIYRASLRLREDAALRSAAATNPTTEIRVSGDRLQLLVEDIHEVVVLDY